MRIRRVIPVIVLNLVIWASITSFLGLAADGGVVAAQASPGPASIFYEFDVVARTNADITGIDNGVSINDNGTVAFIGQVPGGETIYVRNLTDPAPRRINEFLISPNVNFGPTAYINDNDRVITQDHVTASSLNLFVVRTWDGNSVDARTTLASSSNTPFNRLLSHPIINNSNQAAFMGCFSICIEPTPSGLLITGASSPFDFIGTGAPIRPAIADDGRIVYRASTSPTSPIVLVEYDFSNQVIIAGTSTGFDVLGRSPGISADGSVVVFYGDLNAAGATALNTLPGPGIFASIDTGGGSRQVIRVTGWATEDHSVMSGGNRNHICEAGETCVVAAELGLDDAFNPITFLGTGFDPDSRVAVVRSPDLGAGGIQDDHFVVSFIGTPSSASRDNPANPGNPLIFSAQQGLWAVGIDAQRELTGTNNLVFHHTSPLPVVQVGDVIDGKTITSIGVFDPLAGAPVDDAGNSREERRGDHRIAFMAETSGGDIIVRATHLDSDQDGLLDHWETTGIDMDNDGAIDLNLSAMGANPLVRDLFIEMDWVAPRNDGINPFYRHEPAPQVTAALVNMFANAPAVGTIPAGITLHIDAGPGQDLNGRDFSQNMGAGSLQGGDVIGQPGFPNLHIDLIYVAEPGELANIPGLQIRSFHDVKENLFGTTDKWAREFVFHYLVLADFFNAHWTFTGGDQEIFVGNVLTSTSNTLTAVGTPFQFATGTLRDFSSGWFVKVTNGTGQGQIRRIITNTVSQLTINTNWATPPDSTSTFVLLSTAKGRGEAFYWGLPDQNSVPGNDFIVSFGSSPVQANGLLGTAYHQWRAIAHELGHNLGLRHCGILTSPTPCRNTPNSYQSLMSYAHALSMTTSVASYSGASDPTFDDWSNLKLDFSNYFIHLGNSVDKDFNGRLEVDDFEVDPQFNDFDNIDLIYPTATIDQPAPGAAVNTGEALTVTITASDNFSLASVEVEFDKNGSGSIDTPEETQIAANTGGNTFVAAFNNVTGPGGTRTIRVSAIDQMLNTTVTTTSVSIVNTIPIADFSGTPLSGTAPLSVTFADASTGNISTYLWEFGDGITSTVQNPVHTYANAGVFTVTLTVTGPSGTDSLTRTGYVTVNEAPPMAAFSGAPLSGTKPLTVTFTDASTGNITAYFWDFGDGITSTLQNSSHTYTAAGVYTVTLSVAGPGGTDTLTRPSYVSVNEPPPVVDFTGTPLSGTVPLTVTFTDASSGLITGYLWDFGDGITSTMQNPDHTYISAGVYTVTLAATGPGGTDSLTRASYVTVNELPPVVDFSGAPLSGTIPLTVTFTDASSGIISTYLWDFGDGNTSTAQNPSHTYVTAGVYSVTLTATGPGGADSLTRANYVTAGEPPPVADFSGTPLTGVAPLAVSFSDASAGSITTYAWDFGDGNTSSAQNPNHTYTNPGLYTVSLTVTGPGGSDTLTRVDYVTVSDPPPVADFSGSPLSGVAPLAVSFTDASTGNITTYAWDFGDGNTSTAQNPNHTYTIPGLYTVSLTVTGPGGSDTRIRVDYVTVSDPPPVADFSGSPLSGVAPLAVSFSDASAGSITTYAWDFGDGNTSTAQNPNHTYTNPGLYTVSLTVTGPGGSDTRTRVDYVTVNDPPPIADFSGSPLSGVASLSVSFTDASTGNITTYAWDFGDGNTSTAQNPNHTYTNPGLYTVSLTVTGPGGSDTRTRVDYITVSDPPPVADFSGSPLAGTAPLTVTFTDASSGTITSYLWDFGDGSTSAVQNPTHTYSTTGTYTVTLTVTGPGGSDSLTRPGYVTVADLPPVAGFTGSPLTGTVPFTVTFTDASTGLITDYLWVFGDNLTSTLANPSHLYTSAGIYDVSLTVTGPAGSDTLTRTAYVTVNPQPPTPRFVGTPRTGVVPLTVTFTDLSDEDIFTWSWNFGDGTTSTVQNPVHTFVAAGVYTVSLTVTGPGGSSTLTEPRYITVTAPPPVAEFQAEPLSGPPPLTVNFTDLSTGVINAYLWDLGDGTSSTLSNPTHVYSATGVYTVSLTVTGPGGSDTLVRTEYIDVSNQLPPGDVIYVSSSSGGTVAGLAFADEDILAFNSATSTWEIYFDGSDVGLGPVDIDAFTLLADGTILLSLDEPFDVNSNGRLVDDSDILQFIPSSLGENTAGVFALYFSGAPAGLTTASEDIDAIGILADGNLLISTRGLATVGAITADDEDLLLFKPESLGIKTEGSWELYFDGSDVGLADSNDEDVWGTWLDPQTGSIYLTTRAGFAVPGLTGDGADIFVCDPTSLGGNTACTFGTPLFWDGSANGFANERVDGISIAFASLAPVADFEGVPTAGNAPLTVNFTDLSAGQVDAYLWDFGDGNTSTAANPAHQYLTPGVYTVSLTVANETGSDTKTRVNYIDVVAPEVSDTIYVSAGADGIVSGINFADEDILAFDSSSGRWSLYFDGSDVGLGPVDVDAFTLLDDGTILLSLDEEFDVNNNGRKIDDSAILQFTPTSLGDTTAGTFSLYFNGATVGLTTDSEDVDAIAVTAGGDLLISTLGAVDTGTVTAGAEDLLLFKVGSLGGTTSGSWELYFDGSDVGLGDTNGEEIVGTWHDAQTQELYLSTAGGFAVPNLSGDGTDIFNCTPVATGGNTQCTFATSLFWDGSANGLGGQIVDGFTVQFASTTPLANFSAAPTVGNVPLVVNFTDQSLGKVDTYLWDFGDGSISTQQSPIYVYITPGTYSVTLSISGPNGKHTLQQPGLITVAAAPPCTSQCLRVSDIQFEVNLQGQLQAVVAIVDENGLPVTETSASVLWTFPAGETSALTASSGVGENRVVFLLESTTKGTHMVTVTNVVKSGFTFDAAASVLRGSTLQGGNGRFW